MIIILIGFSHGIKKHLLYSTNVPPIPPASIHSPQHQRTHGPLLSHPPPLSLMNLHPFGSVIADRYQRNFPLPQAHRQPFPPSHNFHNTPRKNHDKKMNKYISNKNGELITALNQFYNRSCISVQVPDSIPSVAACSSNSPTTIAGYSDHRPVLTTATVPSSSFDLIDQPSISMTLILLILYLNL